MSLFINSTGSYYTSLTASSPFQSGRGEGCPSSMMRLRSRSLLKLNQLPTANNNLPIPFLITTTTSTSLLFCCITTTARVHHLGLGGGGGRSVVVRASSESKTEEGEGGGGETDGEAPEEEKYYQVVLTQPYGIKFSKGGDGSTYIDAIAPGGSADKSGLFTVGDKVLATSAVFGDEIWPAAEYGRTMYTIRQRIGPLLMKMEKRYGNLPDVGELTEKEIIRAERNAGFISNRVREIQLANSIKKREQKERREKDLREGLRLYKTGQYEQALEKFESVLGSRPDSNEASVASYNVACCYSKLDQVQAGLSALEDALEAGFEDFKRIRTDPDLANIRTSKEFEPLMKKFDESFINENAINAIKSIFGIFNQK